MIDRETMLAIAEHGTDEDRELLRLYLSDEYYKFQPRPDCPEEFDEQTSFVNDRFDGIACCVAGNACLDPETEVRMYDGSVKIARNVCIGDLLMGPDSKPRTVLKTHAGIDEMYRVDARGTKGERFSSYIVNSTHVLSLRKCGERDGDGDGGTRYANREDRVPGTWIYNIRLCDWLKESVKFRTMMQGYRSEAIEYNYQEVDIDPYILGAWLGDGSSGLPHFTTADEEIREAVFEEAFLRGMSVRTIGKTDNAASTYQITTGNTGGKTRNTLLDDLRRYGLLHNKHIPDEYLINSRDVRLKVLAGLIDTDGCCTNGYGFDWVNKNETLSTQVLLLARSLGYRANISKCRKRCANNGKWGDYFRVYIGNAFDVPVRIKRKKPSVEPKYKNPLNYGITVTPLGLGEFCGWELDGDHLFLLADYTVTHNSGKSFSAAFKAAHFLRSTPPPKDLCKYFIASQTLSMVGALWQEKLSKFITPDLIEYVSYWNSAENHPKTVVMKPSENGNRWMLSFRSYEQGRKSFQAISECAGFLCDEQLPNLNLLNEIDTRTREFHYPGSKIYVLTPLEPDEELQERFENPKDYKLWKFYRQNAERNYQSGGLASLQWLDNTPMDMRETRRIGDFANFSGAIYKEFNPAVHVRHEISLSRHAIRFRSIDFGFSHDTVCLLCAEDGNMIYVLKEWGASGMLISEKVKTILELMPGHMTTYADYEDRQQREEFSNLGIHTSPARKEPVTLGIELVRTRMNNRTIVIHSSCKRLISQIKNARWKEPKDNQETIFKERPIKRNDDYVDALRYAVHSREKSSLTAWEQAKVDLSPRSRI